MAGYSKTARILTLGKIIEEIDTFPKEETIYAQKVNEQWTENSPAIVMEEPEDGNLKQTVFNQEFEYLLEIFLARQVMGWLKKLSGKPTLNVEESLKVIVYYREHDAYPIDENGQYYSGS